MNKKYIFIAAVFLAFFGVYFLSGKKETKEDLNILPEIVKTEEKLDSAWIEIVSGKAFLVSGATEVELFSGDKIIVPSSLKTDIGGESNIHFLDGSIMRVGPSSTFDLTRASFEKDTGKIGVIAKLSVGKIWSKIIELATPDSVWQVETSNTVATVRGSAFGVSTDGKTSNIIGSQHRIEVDFKDPKTGKKIDVSSKIVEEGGLLQISESNIVKLKELGDKKLPEDKKKAEEERLFAMITAPAAATASVKAADPWIKNNESKDTEIEKVIESSKLKHKDNKKDFRGELQKNVQDKFEKIRKEKKDKNIIKKELLDNKEVKKEDEGVLKEEPKVEVKLEQKESEIKTTEVIKPSQSGGVVGEEAIAPTKLEIAIVSRELTGNITEGQNLHFKAILYGDGKEIGDITGKAKWEVLGPVGSVDGLGILSAKLDPSVIELGEGSGFVVATWIDEKTGNKIFGKSPLIKVVPNIEVPIDIGGQ